MHRQPKPPEFRHRRRIGACALAVIFVLTLGWLMFHRDSPRKVVFPDGTQVTLHRVTWGAAMEFRRPMPLRRWLGNRLASPWSVGLHPLIPLPEVEGFQGGIPSGIGMVIDHLGSRYTTAEVDKVPEPGHLELIVVQGSRPGPFVVEVLDDSGATLEAYSVVPSLPVALHRQELRWVDWQSERLRFRIRGGGVEKTVELRNPRPTSTLRRFREPMEPFPAIRRRRGVEMHLTGLRPSGAGLLGKVGWAPELRFLRGNRDVTEEMTWQYRFEDADGRVHSRRLLPSEPKWRVRIQAWPTTVPEPDDGYGLILRLPQVPGEGEWIPLPDSEVLRSRGVVGGGFSGPGNVSVTDGIRDAHRREGDPVESRPERPRITADSWKVRSRGDHVVLWLALDTRGVGRLPWRDAGEERENWWGAYRTSDDTWAQGKAELVDHLPGLERRLFRVDLFNAKPGEIRLQVRLAFNETFLIAAPTASAESEPAAEWVP
jgi:hypothetical protein